MSNEMLKHENALEMFAVNRWKEAEICGDTAGWSRAYEHFSAVQLFLTCLRFDALASAAQDLKVIAGMRGGMPPDRQVVSAFKPRLAARW
jgi:hypothetical protein